MSTISIITPTYNHAAYIGKCITSVREQTIEDWEMIIIDDGSTDGTEAVVHSFVDSRIRYHRQQHIGITGLQRLYNDALGWATGEFIAIIEGDDFWPPDRLASLLEAFDRSEVVVTYGITQIVDSQGEPRIETIPRAAHLQSFRAVFDNRPLGIAVAAMLKNNALWPGAVSSLIRRKGLDKIGGFLGTPEGSLVDRPTFFALGLVGEFCFVPHVTGFWRRHPASGTNSLLLWVTIARDLADYIDEFVGARQATLMLSNRDVREIRTYWEHVRRSAQIAAGRACLVRGKYSDARAFFGANLGTIRGVLNASSWCGYFASLLRCDIEGLYRLFGRTGLSESSEHSGRASFSK